MKPTAQAHATMSCAHGMELSPPHRSWRRPSSLHHAPLAERPHRPAQRHGHAAHASHARGDGQAPVGDDVYGEDPTVLELEARVAAMCGMEAALFLPSGTMANAVAVRTHTRPGDEIVLEKEAHIYLYEGGGFAALSGCSVASLTETAVEWPPPTSGRPFARPTAEATTPTGASSASRTPPTVAAAHATPSRIWTPSRRRS